jgi:menaquinone-dependent protoporphyrinogen oxidase
MLNSFHFLINGINAEKLYLRNLILIKALIVYGTRYGATEMTSKEIADVFQKEGLDVEVVNLKDEKIKDINNYDLVVVGSGIQIGKWTKEPKKFLKKYQKELAKKKVAIFVSCGSAQPLPEDKKTPEEIEKTKRKYLNEKATEYNLQPIALGFFGGVYNFNRVSWLFKKFMSSVKPQLKAAGIPEKKPGLYDTRNIKNIRAWAKEVVDLAQF